jgi:hypothetical protein
VVTVVDQSIAQRLGPTPDGVYVVPRDAVRWWRGRSAGRWRPLNPDRVLDVLCDLPRPGVVLTRPATVDPGAAFLATAATLVGHDVIMLPAVLDEAIWSVGVTLAIGVSDAATLARVLDVVCCGPGSAPSLPRQIWGPTGLSVPALRPATLARWAYCAWRPCSWCDAGGLPGHRCRRCGAPVHDIPVEVAEECA